MSKAQLFENKIFNQLYTSLSYRGKLGVFGDTIGYYQKKTGAEIDFIVERKSAYEVKTTAGGFDVRRLQKTASRLGIANYAVVTLEKIDKELPHLIYPYNL